MLHRPLHRVWSAVLTALLVLGGSTEARAALRVVVTPKAGTTYDAAPLKVSVRGPYAAGQVRVYLNGRDISREFPRRDVTKQGRRVATVSASHGLRYGANRLAVIRRKGGRKVRESVRFRLRRTRPLVGAGRDRTVLLGESLRLDGRASRPRKTNATSARASQAGSAAGLKMAWKLVDKPRGSTATLEMFTSTTQPTRAALQRLSDPSRQPARPLLSPDKPGRYVAELVVSDRGVTSVADTVVTTATFATPSVQVNTAANSGSTGQRGIAVGYPGGAPPAGGQIFSHLPPGNALQAVALDRRTLELIASYQWLADEGAISGLTSFIDKNDSDTRLIIVTAWADPAWANVAGGNPSQALTKPGQGVGLIGATALTQLDENSFGLGRGGQHSWIGVPGFAAGQAWSQTGKEPDVQGVEVAALTGYLSPDNNFNYAYLPRGPQAFSAVAGPAANESTITAGAYTATSALSPGAGGFIYAFLDGHTLAPITYQGQTTHTVQTTNPAGQPAIDQVTKMADDLSWAATQAQPITVLVRSIGPHPLALLGQQPPEQYNFPLNFGYANQLERLANAVAALGGHAQEIFGMATNPKSADAYTLIGNNYVYGSAPRGTVSAEGTATDLGTAQNPTPSSTNIAGVLSKDRRQRYAVRGASSDGAGAALAQAAVAEPTPWPSSSTPGERAALACIGTQTTPRLGDDPRTAYWNESYDDGTWGQIQEQITGLAKASCAGASPTDVKNVAGTLEQEIDWLINARGYITSLTEPFASSSSATGLKDYADLEDITTSIVQAAQPPPERSVGIDWADILGDVLDLGAEFDVPVIGSVAATLFIGADLFADGQQGPPVGLDERIEATSAQVGEALADRLSALSSSADHITDLIVADYGRLKTVGSLGNCAAGPGCPSEWQAPTQAQQNAAGNMYELNAKRQIWGGVLPAAYPTVIDIATNAATWRGFWDPPSQSSWPWDLAWVTCNNSEYRRPFNGITSPVGIPYGITWFTGGAIPPPNVPGRPFFVLAKRDFKGSGSPRGIYPPASLLTAPRDQNPLFTALDPGGNPDRGGLGLDEYRFLIDNWSGDPGAPLPARQGWRGC